MKHETARVRVRPRLEERVLLARSAVLDLAPPPLSAQLPRRLVREEELGRALGVENEALLAGSAKVNLRLKELKVNGRFK